MGNKAEPFDLEQVYDDKISPLMVQIIAICKEHKMPMAATFTYRADDEGGLDHCTTLMGLRGDPHGVIRRIREVVYNQAEVVPSVFGITITTTSEEK